MVNSDGTGVTSLTHNRVGETGPAWQPVGASQAKHTLSP